MRNSLERVFKCSASEQELCILIRIKWLSSTSTSGANIWPLFSDILFLIKSFLEPMTKNKTLQQLNLPRKSGTSTLKSFLRYIPFLTFSSTMTFLKKEKNSSEAILLLKNFISVNFLIFCGPKPFALLKTELNYLTIFCYTAYCYIIHIGNWQ